MILDVFLIFFIHAVKAIAFKLNLCGAVAVYTPAHAQRGKLEHFIIAGNFTMTGLALHPSCIYVLGMAEENMVGQVVYAYPFNWFGFAGIPGFAGLKACILI